MVATKYKILNDKNEDETHPLHRKRVKWKHFSQYTFGYQEV